MMSLKKIGAALLVLFLFSVSVNHFFTRVAADNFNEVTVTYSKSPLSGLIVNKAERFAVHFGKGYGTFTAVGMLPNGTPVFLGFYGGTGMFRMNFKALLKYSKIWNDYMVRMGIDPESVNPGILFLGTVKKDDHLYSTAFSVPIRVDKILKGYSTKVEATPSMVKLSDSYLKPLKKQVSNETVSVNSIWDDYPPSLQDSTITYLLNLVPARLDENCYTSGVCLYWAPDYRILSYGLNASIPVVITHIWGQVDDRDAGYVSMFMATKSSSGVSISFSALGVQNDGGSVTPISGGPMFTLKDQGEWIDHVIQFHGRDLPNGEDSYVISGIVGHYVVMRFRLYGEGTDDTGQKVILPYDDRAFFTIVVPVFEKTPEGTRIRTWDGIFSGSDGSKLVGEVKDITHTFEEYRDYNFVGQFHVDMWQLKSESHYTPLLSLGVSVDDLGAIPVAGFSIGMSSKDASLLKMDVGYNPWNSNQKFEVTTYKLNDMFVYNKESYIIPVMYVDIYELPKYVSLPSPPHPVYPPVYPLDTS
ncbi:hypothetical protein A3L09_02165 [Thermococcus profundus]|uniref:Uncharacterized protein n=2 Tax=Thermococcus profundus TaxID=49899 RepID=A0A2Z2M8Y2_THEPR|nr:hypothetical protein A3L09_02165 [Thermococcus profundus]